MLLLLFFTYYRNNLSQFPFSALGGGDDLTADIVVHPEKTTIKMKMRDSVNSQ